MRRYLVAIEKSKANEEKMDRLFELNIKIIKKGKLNAKFWYKIKKEFV